VTQPVPGQGAARAKTGADIESALLDIARHLEARDAISAAGAIEHLATACAAAAKAGIDDVARTRLQPLMTRCTALAMETRATLAASLARLGNGSRAHRAYRAE
jgi:hypothetical protein